MTNGTLISRGAAIGAIVLAAATAGASGPEVVRGLPNGEQCTTQCASGEAGQCAVEPLHHRAPSSGPELTHSGEPHSDCHEGSCAAWHAPCALPGLPDAVDAAVATATRTGDAAPLVRLVTSQSKYAQLKADRLAVQVVDCSGRVVAHLPVPRAVVAMVAAATSSNE